MTTQIIYQNITNLNLFKLLKEKKMRKKITFIYITQLTSVIIRQKEKKAKWGTYWTQVNLTLNQVPVYSQLFRPQQRQAVVTESLQTWQQLFVSPS